MFWYWKVRMYKPGGNVYRHAQIRTPRNLHDITVVEDFYFELTGSKMLIEGMSEESFALPTIGNTFANLLMDPS